MDKLVKPIFGTSESQSSNDDDFCDRLNSRYTFAILVVFAVFTTAGLLIGKPMTCWTPSHFTKSHRVYATNYCWIRNTYYLPWSEDTHTERGHKKKDRNMITYYQWIPFILIGQAILFYLPRIVWHGLSSRSGVDADNILSTALTFSRTNLVEVKERTMKILTSQMTRFLGSNKKTHGHRLKLGCANCCDVCGRRVGNYLLLLFFFSKVCYIGNAIGQLFLLNVILSTKYNTFGFDYVKEMLNNDVQAEYGYVAFPRVTLCDFEIRGQDMNNVQRYTIQCVLPLNLYNELIYIFLWYWMVFVAGCSCLNLLIWFLRVSVSQDRRNFVRNHLLRGGVKFTSIQLRKFTYQYLRQDGCLLLRLIAHNSDSIATVEITRSLFRQHFGIDGDTDAVF